MKYLWSRFSDFVRLSLLQSFDILTNFAASFITMAEGVEVFNWIRQGYKLVTVKFEWIVQVPFHPFFHSTDFERWSPSVESPLFSAQETPNSKWKLDLMGSFNTAVGSNAILIYVVHHNAAGKPKHFNKLERIFVKMSILDQKGRKFFDQQALYVDSPFINPGMNFEFLLFNESLIKSECQQADESYTFCCEIFTHVKQKITPPGNHSDVSSDAINCLNELSSHFEELFDSMPLSDVNFNIGGRDFSAHKNILSARSEVFAAMFQHPSKEKATNQIEIEDIEPDVFDQLLRFIYTGRVQVDKLEVMVACLFTAADKYLLDQLKLTCQNHLLHHMSPENCVVLLNGDLKNPTELLKEAAKFFWRLPSQVMATARWEQMEEENPRLLCQIQKFLFTTK
jgi:speckle-type POZ protein